MALQRLLGGALVLVAEGSRVPKCSWKRSELLRGKRSGFKPEGIPPRITRHMGTRLFGLCTLGRHEEDVRRIFGAQDGILAG